MSERRPFLVGHMMGRGLEQNAESLSWQELDYMVDGLGLLEKHFGRIGAQRTARRMRGIQQRVQRFITQNKGAVS